MNNNIREILGNATMAYTNMSININTKKIVQNIFELLEENKENIENANKIDFKNDNGYVIDFNMIHRINKKLSNLEDVYRKVISMNKNENNYLEGKEIDSIGTICLVYDCNTYCLLELVAKAILTHNSIIITSESDYMKATNELIVILIQRILDTYKIDKNLVQILYTSRVEELLSNSASIKKVIAIGNKYFQSKIAKISQIEVIGKGYNYYDIYIEDIANLSFVERIIGENKNIDIYVKNGVLVPFDDYIEVEDIDEAIAQINFNTSGYSSSIFTENNQNASEFLKRIKTSNISVNSSPLIEEIVDININLLVLKKNMFYPNPLTNGTEKNKFEFSTERAILEKNRNNKEKSMIEEIKAENSMLKKNSEQIQENSKLKLKQKEIEINSLKRQLSESQSLANKYIGAFEKSFFVRLFGRIKKQDIQDDTKLLS